MPEACVLQGVAALVVDDNSTNRQMLDELAQPLGNETDAGRERKAQGLKFWNRRHAGGEPIPLILLDSDMPDMDGFTFAKRVKSDPRFKAAIIMMLTSGGQRGDAARCRDLRISAYLVKPIQQAELQEAILTVPWGTSSKPAESSAPRWSLATHCARIGAPAYSAGGR